MPQTTPEMTADDVLAIVELLERNQIEVHVDGGWGVDALEDRPSSGNASFGTNRLNSPNQKSVFKTPMAIELSKEARQEAVASLQRYFQENLEQEIGNLATGALLNFILEEIGPSIYNKGVADAQERMQARISELDGEVFEAEFQYWRKHERSRGGRR